MARRWMAILATLWMPLMMVAQWLPTKSNHLLTDYSGVIEKGRGQAIEQRLVAFADSTSNQVAVVITPTLGGDDVMAVAQRIGESWGVGQEEFDNGVVILIKSKTAEENWGEVAIATGYGVEGVLPDVFCKHIIDDMVGPLGEGNYAKAIEQALDVLLPVLAGEYSYAQYRKDERRKMLLSGLVSLLVIGGLVVLLVWYARKHPHDWGGTGVNGGGSYLGGFPSGSVGGSGWGGFGGFGGGSFGGGGASGRF